jgi:hypothetical protein
MKDPLSSISKSHEKISPSIAKEKKYRCPILHPVKHNPKRMSKINNKIRIGGVLCTFTQIAGPEFKVYALKFRLGSS